MVNWTQACHSMNQQLYPLPTVASVTEGDIIAYISLVTAMSPWIQLATWLQLPCSNNYDWHQHRNCSQGLLAVTRFIKATDTEVIMITWSPAGNYKTTRWWPTQFYRRWARTATYEGETREKHTDPVQNSWRAACKPQRQAPFPTTLRLPLESYSADPSA